MPHSKQSNPNMETIKQHCFRGKYSGRLFTIGYNGSRVGFYSQQVRANNLSYLLFQTASQTDHAHWNTFELESPLKEKKLNTKIGIVGGGLSGTLLMMNLYALGFKNITLFESSPQILCAQAGIKHRYAHPSYNDWPLNYQKEFRSTTSLPWLNWYAGTADQILDLVGSDEYLKSLKTHFFNNASPKIFVDHVVEKVNIIQLRAPNSEKMVWVKFKKLSRAGWEYPDTEDPDAQSKSQFDVVVLANGFGREEHLDQSDSNSYWWPDVIEQFNREKHNFPDKKFEVSGRGDGALIDAARVLIKNESKLITEQRNICWETIARLRHDKYKAIPFPDEQHDNVHSTFEEEYVKLLESQERNSDQNEYENLWPTSPDDDSPVNLTAPDLPNLLRQDYFCEQFLGKNLTLSYSGNGSVFTSKTAPINKLIIAYLITAHYINPDQIKPNSEFNVDEARTDIQYLILRHGTKSAAEMLLGSDVNDEVFPECSKPENILDVIPIDFFQEFVNQFGEIDRLNYIADLVYKFLQTYFEDAIQPQMMGTESDPTLVVKVSDTNNNRNAYLKFGGFDPDLFGLPVKYELVPPSDCKVPQSIGF